MNKLSRPELDEALDKLEAWLVHAMDADPHCDLIKPFAVEADVIRVRIADEDRVHFNTRVQCMLRDAGLIPGDEVPCSED